MKTKLFLCLTTARSFLLATLPVQAVQAAQVKSDVGANLLQFTAGGHALGFAADGMYVTTGSHALRGSFAGANAVQPQVMYY